MTDAPLHEYPYRPPPVSPDFRICGHRSIGARGALVHTTSGTNSLPWLEGGSADAGSPASAEYLVARNGSQFDLHLDENFAYHAGRSRYELDRQYNNTEVSQVLFGIELECLDEQACTFEQYDSLAAVIVAIAPQWGWRWPFIILGHYAVARPLGRRSDPVNFDWGWLMGRLYVRALAAQIPGLVKD